jgi:hypothetical protein
MSTLNNHQTGGATTEQAHMNRKARRAAKYVRKSVNKHAKPEQVPALAMQLLGLGFWATQS